MTAAMKLKNCKEIKPVNPKGNQPWIFIERTDAEAEAPILWPPDAKNWLIGKDPDAGKDEGKRRKGSQRIRWLDSIINSMDMNLSKLWEMVKDRGACHPAVHGVKKSWTRLSNWTTTKFSQFSCSVVSDSLGPHRLQHAWLPYLSPTPRACSNSCPLSWWCHPTISSSVIPFSSSLQSFPASGLFKWVHS